MTTRGAPDYDASPSRCKRCEKAMAEGYQPLARFTTMSNKLNLKEYISSKQKKQRYVNQMFETIAPRYDFITVFLSYGMDQGWKRRLIEMLDLKGDEKALDLACGTGDI